MTDSLRWGIAGPGSIGASMAEALATLPDAEVVAVGSRSQERADAFADRHAVPHSLGSYEALFADDDVDIVYVASPHSEHHAMTLAALDAGRHVVCEKAFALDAAQAREMAAAAASNQRFLMEAMWTWFLPPIIEVRRRIEAGDIGELRAVQSSFGLSVPGETGRLRELALAGGALLDLGVYPVAFTRLLLGAPSEVRAVGQLGPTGVDVNVGAVLGHPDGAVSVFHTGLDALTPCTADLVGTEGIISIRAPFWATDAFVVAHHDGRERERVSMPHGGLAHEAAHAMERIRGGHLESDVIPLATTISIMETLDFSTTRSAPRSGSSTRCRADLSPSSRSGPSSPTSHWWRPPLPGGSGRRGGRGPSRRRRGTGRGPRRRRHLHPRVR